MAIWASFGFRYAIVTTPENWTRNVKDGPQRDGSYSDGMIRFAQDHHLLPEAYLGGFRYQLATQVRQSFFNGQHTVYGSRGFFPYCIAVKTPLSVFALLALAGWMYLRGAPDTNADVTTTRSRRLARLYEIAPLVALLGVYWAFALTSSLNIGLRHLLPTYPPMFILAGAAALCFQAPSAAARRPASSLARCLIQGIAVTALVINVVEACWCWPHYLAYFNLLAGGASHGYRHLVDSSLDWGRIWKA